jgi:hypothetical protein
MFPVSVCFGSKTRRFVEDVDLVHRTAISNSDFQWGRDYAPASASSRGALYVGLLPER